MIITCGGETDIMTGHKRGEGIWLHNTGACSHNNSPPLQLNFLYNIISHILTILFNLFIYIFIQRYSSFINITKLEQNYYLPYYFSCNLTQVLQNIKRGCRKTIKIELCLFQAS